MEKIGPAGLDDIAQLAALLGALFAQEADFTPDRPRQEEGLRLIINSPSTGVILVARIDDEIAGMVSLLFTVSTAQGAAACWLEDMIVHPDQRGSGLGSRLLQQAIGYARERGCARLTLLTDRVNIAAQRFYARHGFQESAMTALRLNLDVGSACSAVHHGAAPRSGPLSSP